jgi:hypothetical protein
MLVTVPRQGLLSIDTIVEFVVLMVENQQLKKVAILIDPK